jgi:FkbM family methyltransferase
LLIEPCKKYKSILKENRPDSIIDSSAIVPKSYGQVLFYERINTGLSSLEEIKDNSIDESAFLPYYVDTTTLSEVLEKYQLPKEIDFLSIDVEGLEFEILASLDFSDIFIGVICVEHNFRDDREKIFSLLSREGFTRYSADISVVDDYYVNDKLRH